MNKKEFEEKFAFACECSGVAKLAKEKKFAENIEDMMLILSTYFDKDKMCIENGKLCISENDKNHAFEVEPTKNQKKIIENIKTGSNFVFDLYRNSGFTTVLCNFLAYWLVKSNKKIIFITDRKSIRFVFEKIYKILDYYSIPNIVRRQHGFLNVKNGSKIEFADRQLTIGDEKYDVIIMDNAAFIEDFTALNLYDLKCDAQKIIGSCHNWIKDRCNNRLEYEFNETIRIIKTQNEPPYNWFHVLIRWWDDEKYLSGLRYNEKNKLTSEMCEFITNKGGFVSSDRISQIASAMDNEKFSAEMLNGNKNQINNADKTTEHEKLISNFRDVVEKMAEICQSINKTINK